MRAQTATEYLVILAVVLVVGLIVVATLGGIPSLSSQDKSVINQKAASQKVGIKDFTITSAGVQFRIQNNLPNPIKVTDIRLDGEPIAPSRQFPVRISVGDNALIQTYAGLPDYGEEDATVNINYTVDGASYAQDDVDIAFDIPDSHFMEDLWALYHFEEDPFLEVGVVHDVLDSSGNGRDGWVWHWSGFGGGATANHSTGHFGQGMEMKACSGDVCGVNVSGTLPQNVTIGLWAKNTGDVYSDMGNYFLHNGVALTDGARGFSWDSAGTDTISLWLDNGVSATACEIDYAYSFDGTWTHVTFAWNNTHCWLYIDGSEAATDTWSGPLADTVSAIMFGGHSGGAVWGGIFDEVGIWSRVLTADEIADIYAYGR